MADTIRIDQAALAQELDGLVRDVNYCVAEGQDMGGDMRILAEAWQGEAAVAFQQAAGRWNTAFENCVRLLQQLGNDLDAAADMHNVTDNRATSLINSFAVPAGQ